MAVMPGPRSSTADIEVRPDLSDIIAEACAFSGRDHVGGRPIELDVVSSLESRRTMGQHENSVGHRHRFLDVMGDQEDRFSAVADKIDGVALDQELGLEIKRGKGFIEKQNVGVVDQSASERHAL